MKSEQTVKLKQNLSGLYDVTIEDKKGRIKSINNLTFEVALKIIDEELWNFAKEQINEERDKL